jgi:SAM-dependent methyltransferase
MPGRDEWTSIAESADAADLREHILTGFKAGKPFTPYASTLDLPANLNQVLDFGCGVGRNFPYLRTVARHVTGFDLPPMIARCRELGEPVDGLFDDWRRVRARRFDLIFASLVLQHIETDLCRQYLENFSRMAPAVYLLTRSESDFGERVLDLVADAGVYDPGACREVDHDPQTNQLRVLSDRSFEEARASGGSTHYELLLRSKHSSAAGS